MGRGRCPRTSRRLCGTRAASLLPAEAPCPTPRPPFGRPPLPRPTAAAVAYCPALQQLPSRPCPALQQLPSRPCPAPQQLPSRPCPALQQLPSRPCPALQQLSRRSLPRSRPLPAAVATPPSLPSCACPSHHW
ncbi:unnamed protein product [Closterium sp. NIES-54]